MRRYTVMFEDLETFASYDVARCWTRAGMMRKVRKGNARVNGVPIRFFGKIGG